MVAAVCAVLAAVWVLVRRPAASPPRVFRMGFESSPPRQMVSADGQPYGPTVDTVGEAARRAGVSLRWVLRPEGPEAAMAAHRVDLWPLLADLPRRRGTFYFSAPYLRPNYWLVSLKPLGITSLQKARGRRIGCTRSVATPLVQAEFPSSILISHPSAPANLRAVCTGEVDAAVTADDMAEASLAGALAGCGAFNLIPVPIGFGSGIGANPGDRGAIRAADAIRERLVAAGVEWLWLGPRLTAVQIGFALLTLAGVVIGLLPRSLPDVPKGVLRAGIAWALALSPPITPGAMT